MIPARLLYLASEECGSGLLCLGQVDHVTSFMLLTTRTVASLFSCTLLWEAMLMLLLCWAVICWCYVGV